MFISKDDLKLMYGVDLEIASAYVDRQVPDGNLYWNKRKVYIPDAPGYYFMPIYSDLLFRLGFDKKYLLSQDFFRLSESILHSAALFEHKLIDWNTHIDQLKSIASSFTFNRKFYEKLIQYLDQKNKPHKDHFFGTKFPSLNRSDSYLLTLILFSDQYIDMKEAVNSWYSIMTYFLIMDDLIDIEDDLKADEENAFIDAGLNESGFREIFQMVQDAHDYLLSVNPVLANRIDHKIKTMDLKSMIRSIVAK